MLRCKPGDMAMVTGKTFVNAYGIVYSPALPYGTFVTVVAHVDGFWQLAEEIPLPRFGGIAVRIVDSVLTPYRPWEQPAADSVPAECNVSFG